MSTTMEQQHQKDSIYMGTIEEWGKIGRYELYGTIGDMWNYGMGRAGIGATVGLEEKRG